MRPIDADALIEKCGDWYVEEGTESGFIGTLKNLLATEPTIQPEKAQLSCEGTTKGATSALNNQVNLCDSCTYTYPECPSEKDDVIFGNGIGNDNICACNKYQPTIQPVATDTNVGDKISKFIDGLEEIFADLRERHVDDSACGLCEYDGAYMGQSGDWCNECPGFDKDDCFKLKGKYREEWLSIDG